MAAIATRMRRPKVMSGQGTSASLLVALPFGSAPSALSRSPLSDPSISDGVPATEPSELPRTTRFPATVEVDVAAPSAAAGPATDVGDGLVVFVDALSGTVEPAEPMVALVVLVVAVPLGRVVDVDESEVVDVGDAVVVEVAGGKNDSMSLNAGGVLPVPYRQPSMSPSRTETDPAPALENVNPELPAVARK